MLEKDIIHICELCIAGLRTTKIHSSLVAMHGCMNMLRLLLLRNAGMWEDVFKRMEVRNILQKAI